MRVDTEMVSELKAVLRERLSLSDQERLAHGRDESYQPQMNPDMVGYPESTAEVASVVRMCARMSTPNADELDELRDGRLATLGKQDGRK